MLLGSGLFGQQAAALKPSKPGPVDATNTFAIMTASGLPRTYPHAVYQVNLEARGEYGPVLHWKFESGKLPPGIMLDDSGLLHGDPSETGEYHFVVSVTDSGKPQQVVKKEFTLKITAAMNLVWKTPAHVSGNRIAGSVEVSNTTADDVDLTFIVLAVAENGRATAIGYQHFTIPSGTVSQKLDFGESLPHGGYVVHVDVVGEVPKRNVIYRERLQTAAALQVIVGP